MTWQPNARIINVQTGTIMTPDFFNDLQDGVIGLALGTWSQVGIVLDGSGGLAATPTARQLEATGGALKLKSTSGIDLLGGSVSITNGVRTASLVGLGGDFATNDTAFTTSTGSVIARLVQANGVSLGYQIFASLQTTDATSTTMYTFALPSGQTVQFTTSYTGHKTDHTTSNSYIDVQQFRNNAGTITQIGSKVQTVIEREDAAWGDGTWTIDGTNIRFKLVGKAATTINWTARIDAVLSGA